MANETFHYFPQLPPEIRFMIWEQCLPNRVAQVDPCDTYFDGRETEQTCDVESVTIENAKQPVVAFINREARQVALQNGRWIRKRPNRIEEMIIQSFWAQQRRDVLHLNWGVENDDSNYCRVGRDLDDHCISKFLLRAEDLRMKRSIVADGIHPFRLRPLLYPDSVSDPWFDAVSRDPIIKYEENNNIPSRNLAGYLLFWPGPDISFKVVMAAVALHITRESAAKSGLFGLLNDAPIQLIDVGDEVTLRKFEDLYRQNNPDKEPKVQEIFEVLLSPEFQAAVDVWKKQVEWLIFAAMWHCIKPGSKGEWSGLDKASLWVPPLSKSDFIFMSRHSPNESHWWVKQAKKKMAILKPQIMVHYCTNECHIAGRLPEDFKISWKF
jgi:hypothetical protein